MAELLYTKLMSKVVKKEDWFKWVLLGLGILLLAGGFYWYEIRPKNIAKECIRGAAIINYNAKQKGYQAYSVQDIELMVKTCKQMKALNLW